MKKLIVLLLTFVLCLPLCACAARADQTTVVCSFYPIYIFTENVLAGVPGASVSSLTPPTTGCLHDYQLLTSDMRALAKASVLIVNGAGMESFLPDVKKQLPDLAVVDCSEGVELLSDPHGENAHIWLDAKNAMRMVWNIAEGLKAVFPDSAEVIAKNADEYINRLDALDKELFTGLSGLQKRDIVTFHEAFPYFAKAYGLNTIASVTLDPDEAPSPAELSRVIEKVRAAGNCPLFSEPGADSDALKTVAAETGALIYTLDPVTTGDGRATDYEDKMRENMNTLKQALQ